MRIKEIYEYIRSDGGVSVSPTVPDCEYTVAYRLIADEGKFLTDGTERYLCIDIPVSELDKWSEVI